MEMDDVPRFELARDNMPQSKLAQEGRLSKGNLVQLSVNPEEEGSCSGQLKFLRKLGRKDSFNLKKKLPL